VAYDAPEDLVATHVVGADTTSGHLPTANFGRNFTRTFHKDGAPLVVPTTRNTKHLYYKFYTDVV